MAKGDIHIECPDIPGISESKNKAVRELRDNMAKIKVNAIDTILMFRHNPELLTHSGYKTMESFVMGTIIKIQVQCDKLTKEFINSD